MQIATEESRIQARRALPMYSRIHARLDGVCTGAHTGTYIGTLRWHAAHMPCTCSPCRADLTPQSSLPPPCAPCQPPQLTSLADHPS